MEEADNKQTTASASGAVMDVASPKTGSIPIEVKVSAAPAPAEVTEAPTETVAPEDTKSEIVTETPELAPAVTGSEESSDQPPADKNPLAIDQPPKKKSGAPVAAIIVAIVIAIVLAGLTVYAWMKTSKKTATTTQTTTAKVTTNDVDQAGKDVDNTLSKTNDSKDFSSADLTDQTLGL